MPLLQSMVGRTGEPVAETVEPRWLMNYAAAVGDINPVYYDTLAAEPAPAHPAYVSHLEWDAIGRLHEELPEIDGSERLLGVHSFNDTTIHSPVRSGQELSSTAQVIGVESRRSGAKLSLRIETRTLDGLAVSTSYTSSIFRGVPVSGDDVVPELPEATPAGDWVAGSARTGRIDISPIAAHLFSECARDYSPIHTDIAFATVAGLPGLILHGTGTVAKVLSDLIAHEGGANPASVQRFRVRFGAMVLCPSQLTLMVTPHRTDPHVYRFDLLTEDGAPAIKDGLFHLGEAAR